jgi:hypothetical protein
VVHHPPLFVSKIENPTGETFDMANVQGPGHSPETAACEIDLLRG